jgi:hypothetical protein
VAGAPLCNGAGCRVAAIPPGVGTAGFGTAGFGTAGLTRAGLSRAGFGTAGLGTAGLSTAGFGTAGFVDDTEENHGGPAGSMWFVPPRWP